MFRVSELLGYAILLSNMSVSASLETSTSTPLPPSQDPWYTAPANFEQAAPGTVLRLRTAPGDLTSIVVNASAAYNVLYRTTDSRRKPAWAVTTVLVPTSSKRDCHQPAWSSLLSYMDQYDVATVDASPSYGLYSNPLSDISTALGKGWVVNIPDYEGPLASFIAGLQSGQAALDSVRATLSLSKTLGLTLDAKNVLWGYSGGGFAVVWAAELQPTYAPELHISGAAIGGMVANATSSIEAINGGTYAGLIPVGLIGLTSQFPEVREVLVSSLKTEGEYNSSRFLAAANMTRQQWVVAYAGQDIYQYFKNGASDILEGPIRELADRDGTAGHHGVPELPLFVYQAIQDQVNPAKPVDTLVEKYCSKGASILYERNSVGGHMEEAANGAPSAWAWLTSILAGEPQQNKGCVVRNVTISLV